uniref:DNA repair and recombination protein RAD54-like n=1 Tax=Lygus hesperus TaxID=30085 RepID=A0A146LH21_LYGHE
MRRSLAPSQRNKFNSPLTVFTALSSSPHSKQHSQNKSDPPPLDENRDCKNPRSFSVVYGKPSKKKHKVWDGDGILEVDGKSAVLRDTNGKIIGQTGNLKKCDLEDGTILFVGSKEVEISSEIVQNPIGTTTDVSVGCVKRKSSCIDSPAASPVKKDRKVLGNVHPVAVGRSTIVQSKVKTAYEPLSMPVPNDSHQWQCNTDNLALSPVIVEGFLCKVLRTHQREGVTFLYNCVSGMRDVQHKGAILADEMGLGKTLQCITLVWTLLKQGPYGNVPLAKKVLIVVPSSLVQNWKNEFTRWIGSHKIQPFVVDKNNRPKDFNKSRSPVLIISYEMFVKSHEDVKENKFDLMICDEGHRLKNSSIKATCLLNEVSCSSRVLLTGTPIQNDLQEFYALVNFVNPGILGSPAQFGRNFEKPILESKEPHCSSEALDNGKLKSDELNRLTSDFILRRTQELIGKYLPQKTEYVVLCAASELQKKLYSTAVKYWTERMDELGDREMPRHLSVITALKKICNHPFLLNSPADDDLESLAKILGDETRAQFVVQDSGKLMVVESIMKSLLGTKERLILVSNFTQTLDILAKVCSRNECNYLRFDGSTPVSQRNSIVSQFNNLKSPVQVLLLSSKAGGVGLNLIGGSRLILYDSDWNPATDLQAMARIWREGQTKNVHIYRLLTSGTIEEKIFQRQLKKTGLSENIVDSSDSNCVKLSKEELRDLFTYSPHDKCLTHDSLNCSCLGDGTIVEDLSYDSDANSRDGRDCQIELQPSKVPTSLRMNQLLHWEHHGHPVSESVIREMLSEHALKFVNFVFRNKTS